MYGVLTTVSPLVGIALSLAALRLPGASAYTCEGTGCCNYVCGSDGSDASGCMRNSAGASIPKWWMDNRNGWESCLDKISANYDTATPCSKAIRPEYPCGTKDSFACGYGLACVPQTISYAQCIPICGSRYAAGGRKAEALEGFDVSKVTAGCTLDGQSGTMNPDAGYKLDVGEVISENGIALPKCVAATAVNADAPRTPTASVSSDDGSTAGPILVNTPPGSADIAPPIARPPEPLTPVPVAAGDLELDPSSQSDPTAPPAPPMPPPESDTPIEAPSVPPSVPTPDSPMALEDMSAEQERRLKLANQAAGLHLSYMEVCSCCCC